MLEDLNNQQNKEKETQIKLAKKSGEEYAEKSIRKLLNQVDLSLAIEEQIPFHQFDEGIISAFNLAYRTKIKKIGLIVKTVKKPRQSGRYNPFFEYVVSFKRADTPEQSEERKKYWSEVRTTKDFKTKEEIITGLDTLNKTLEKKLEDLRKFNDSLLK